MQLPARDCIAPLLEDIVSVGRGGHARPVRARRCQRLAVRLNESRETAMRCPPYSNATFRPAQLLAHAMLSPWKYQGQWTWPEARGKLRGITGEVESKPR